MSETQSSFEEKIRRFFATEYSREHLYILANALFCSTEQRRGLFHHVVYSNSMTLLTPFRYLSKRAEERMTGLRDTCSMSMCLIALDEQMNVHFSEFDLALQMVFIFATAESIGVLQPWMDTVGEYLASESVSDTVTAKDINNNLTGFSVWCDFFSNMFPSEKILHLFNTDADEKIVSPFWNPVTKHFIVPDFDLTPILQSIPRVHHAYDDTDSDTDSAASCSFEDTM